MFFSMAICFRRVAIALPWSPMAAADDVRVVAPVAVRTTSKSLAALVVAVSMLTWLRFSDVTDVAGTLLCGGCVVRCGGVIYLSKLNSHTKIYVQTNGIAK